MNDMKILKNHSSSKKHKKHKKNKKKSKKEARPRSSDSDSSEAEMEWVEASDSKEEPSKPKHEDWMNAESFVNCLTRQELMSGSSSRRKKEQQELQKTMEESIQKSRELNPHWKNDGSGLPQEEVDVDSLRLPSTSVGDGGYNYLKKAYLRIKEQAQEEGRSMEDVAVQRWGSLSKLQSMIEEAEVRMKNHSKHRYESNPQVYDKSHHKSFRKPYYKDASPSPERSFRFQKPKDDHKYKEKVGSFSSSGSKKKHSSFSARSEKEHSHLIYPPSSTESRACKKDVETESRFASPPRSQAPSWKKVKRDTTEGDNKSYSHPQKEGKYSTHDRFASPPRSQVPSWKKVKSVAQDVDHKEERKSPSPEKPVLSKSSGNSLVIKSKDDLNKLAAKYLKADMMGDKALAAKLKVDLEEAKRAFEEGDRDFTAKVSNPKEKVLLTKADSSGFQRPIQSSREDAGFERRSGNKKTVNKYFDDGSKYSLKQMFEREKLTTADDNLEMFMEVAAEAKESTDDNETSGITRKASHKMSHGVQEEKDIQKAINQHQKMKAAVDKCEYCMDQPNVKRHLLVTIQNQVYLSVPSFESLTKGHSLIVPKRHVTSFLHLDEDEWNEIEELKSLLRNVFRMQKKTVLFLETSYNFKWCPHAFLECIPVPEEEGDMAPFYFKKAIQESEEEWAHNIKLVDLSKKGLRKSIPQNLPYFCVIFDPAVHAGFAHVIENEKSFPRNFGKEVIGGMLDIDYNNLYKNKKADALKKSKEALELTKTIKGLVC